MKVYLPTTIDSGDCVELYSNGIIRVYDASSFSNGTCDYVEYYTDMGYLSTSKSDSIGVDNFSELTCIDHDSLTTNVYFRLDFPEICIEIAVIIGIIMLGLSFIFKSFFRGWGR